MNILTSVWSVQHPNAGQNIQQLTPYQLHGVYYITLNYNYEKHFGKKTHVVKWSVKYFESRMLKSDIITT